MDYFSVEKVVPEQAFIILEYDSPFMGEALRA